MHLDVNLFVRYSQEIDLQKPSNLFHLFHDIRELNKYPLRIRPAYFRLDVASMQKDTFSHSDRINLQTIWCIEINECNFIIYMQKLFQNRCFIDRNLLGL